MAKRSQKKAPKQDQEEMFAAPAVANIDDSDILASLSRWARGFGTDRETLRRALLEHNIEPVAERAGHKLYAFRQVYQAWTADAAEQDPDKLKPFQRRAWYQGEREKLALQVDRGELVDAIEMERTIGRLNQLYVKGLETAQDVIERDCGLTPQQAAKLEAHLDRLREELYQLLAGGDPDDSDESPTPVEPKAEPKKAAAARAPSTSSAVEDAVAFLRSRLAGGPRPSAELVEAGKKAGLSEATLRRAKSQLGAELEAKRQGRGWVWQLAQGAQPD